MVQFRRRPLQTEKCSKTYGLDTSLNKHIQRVGGIPLLKIHKEEIL